MFFLFLSPEQFIWNSIAERRKQKQCISCGKESLNNNNNKVCREKKNIYIYKSENWPGMK